MVAPRHPATGSAPAVLAHGCVVTRSVSRTDPPSPARMREGTLGGMWEVGCLTGETRGRSTRALSKRVDTDGSASQNLEASRGGPAGVRRPLARPRSVPPTARAMCRDAGVRYFASHGTGRVMFGPSLRLNTHTCAVYGIDNGLSQGLFRPAFGPTAKTRFKRLVWQIRTSPRGHLRARTRVSPHTRCPRRPQPCPTRDP